MAVRSSTAPTVGNSPVNRTPARQDGWPAQWAKESDDALVAQVREGDESSDACSFYASSSELDCCEVLSEL